MVSGNMLVANVDNFSWVIPGYAATRPRMVYAIVYDTSLEVAAFKIAKGSGALTAVSKAPADTGANSVTVHPSRRFAYVTNATAATISVYALDATTGAISGPISSQPTNAHPISAVV